MTQASITKLEALPQHWIRSGPVHRVLHAAELLIAPPFDLRDIAIGVYPWVHGDGAPEGCLSPSGHCPVDAGGVHASSTMAKIMLAEYVGTQARLARPELDGLSPSLLRHLKAHAAARAAESNIDTITSDHLYPGYVRSYGGIIAEVFGAGRARLNFIVAVDGCSDASGQPSWPKDQQLAEAIASAILADLLAEGRVVVDHDEHSTLIVGADPVQVRQLAAEAMLN